ncbi:PREDICTED: U2 snRNP-associated SURP motif-containing protein-like [Nelumbo nucifera]|uniref:U2 snRNP-associated SURP motif-containing protein-like n=1 Tax=Nelumbo nucifera TaxID=4432 RepID=A0A1U8Q7P0_NELNU|nr:PREDICTED: U2 snRNP-associated SURP motif-containing protein-like [Nelumbo nucifera]
MAIRSKEGGTVILSGPDGPPVTSVTNQSSELSPMITPVQFSVSINRDIESLLTIRLLVRTMPTALQKLNKMNSFPFLTAHSIPDAPGFPKLQPSRLSLRLPTRGETLVLTPNVPDIMVVPPENDHLRHVIDTMALFVLYGGCAFEQAVMERGRGNPLFNFLFELGSKEHTYYVWRLYSFAQ